MAGKTIGDKTRIILNRIFADRGPQEMLGYVLDRATEGLIADKYNEDTKDCSGLEELIDTVWKENSIVIQKWRVDEKKHEEEYLGIIRESCINLSKSIVKKLAGGRGAEIRVIDGSEIEVYCNNKDKGVKPIARMYAQSDKKIGKLSYTRFIYPRLNELEIRGENGKGYPNFKCPNCNSHDNIEMVASARILVVDNYRRQIDKEIIVNKIINEYTDEIEGLLSKAKGGLSLKLRNKVNSRRAGSNDNIAEFLYERLNRTPGTIGFSGYEDPYMGLFDIFSAYLRFNLNKHNWGSNRSHYLKEELSGPLLSVVRRYRHRIVPFLFFRYGTKKTEKLQGKLIKVIFDDKEPEAINDFYRFRAVARDRGEAKIVRDYLINLERNDNVKSMHKRFNSIDLSDDFIDNPKIGGYESAHFVINTIDGKGMQFQVRDHGMDFKAERYKPQSHDKYDNDIMERAGELPLHFRALVGCVFKRYFYKV